MNNTNTVYGPLAMLIVGSGGSVNSTSNTVGYTITEDTICTNCNLNISKLITDVSCYNDSNGSIDITVTGGLPPYSYIWGNNGSLSEDIFNLQAASYVINLADANGCTTKSIATVSQPTQLSVTINPTDASIGNCDGIASSNVSGGTLTYSYQWNDPLNQNTANADSLCQGIYILTITDGNGCVLIDSVTINDSSLGINQLENNNYLNVYPNPSYGIYTIGIPRKSNGSIEINVTNQLGQIILNQKTNIIIGENSVDINLINEPKGLYFLNIIENKISRSFMLLKE